MERSTLFSGSGNVHADEWDTREYGEAFLPALFFRSKVDTENEREKFQRKAWRQDPPGVTSDTPLSRKPEVRGVVHFFAWV
jgi:hypothetical protein